MPDLLERLRAALSERYAVEREIGSGGMATVFQAEDLKHHRRVAIKVLHPELGAAVGPDRFQREIETVAGLTHPHVLPLHDSGEADGLLFFVMPYVEGESLRHRLDRERQLPVDEAIRITRDVAEALEHAHRHGLIHRDIKPGNILLEEGHAVVTDFGVARALSETGGEKVTATGTSVGTPAYMSPEQAAGEEVDERSDIYALGCVLYEMLAGEPPLVGSTPQSTAAKRLTDRPTPLAALRETVSPHLACVADRALARVPADRFTTAMELYEAIGGASVGEASTRPEPADAGTTRRGGLRNRRMLFTVSTLVIVAALLLVFGLRLGPTGSDAGPPLTAVAVLPFQNLSADGPHSYFAGGLHDELLTQLAKVPSLRVISRTTMRAYEGTALPMGQIAEELGVGSIVEGSVQVVGDRLRVIVQLVDAVADEHLWAESYDRTLEDAFTIQSDVAQQVVVAVAGVLEESDREMLAAPPTKDPEAYALYLQAREYHHRPAGGVEEMESAEELYDRALALDPEFALAHAALSDLHGLFYWQAVDPTPARAASQLQEAEVALRLAPGLPEAHLAMGFYHYTQRDWPAATEEYEVAARDMPSDLGLTERIGFLHRRMANWDKVFEAFDKATRIEPRNADVYSDLGGQTFQLVRRYRDAIRAYDRALTLAPDHHAAALERGDTYRKLTGETDTLRATLRRLPESRVRYYRIRLAFWDRMADSVLHLLRSGEPTQDNNAGYEPASLTAAWAHLMLGDSASARMAFDSALAVLDSMISSAGDDWRPHASRGRALAGLGRHEEALGEVRWLRASRAYREDAWVSPLIGRDLAKILTDIGEHEAAVDEIERELARPGFLTVDGLRRSPTWDALLTNARFQALVAEGS